MLRTSNAVSTLSTSSSSQSIPGRVAKRLGVLVTSCLQRQDGLHGSKSSKQSQSTAAQLQSPRWTDESLPNCLHPLVIHRLGRRTTAGKYSMLRLPEAALNPFANEPCVFKAEPASKTVRVLPMKKFKETVSSFIFPKWLQP